MNAWSGEEVLRPRINDEHQRRLKPDAPVVVDDSFPPVVRPTTIPTEVRKLPEERTPAPALGEANAAVPLVPTLTRGAPNVDERPVLPKVPSVAAANVPNVAESRAKHERTGGGGGPGAVEEGVNALANVFTNSFAKLKKMLGLSPNCLNGGTKTLQGECVCPKYFKGKLCEEIVCINNGTRVKVPNSVPGQFVCKCTHQEYISGNHCEVVKCMNGGSAMNNGHCKCLDYWYTGRFCQDYTASWGAVLGVPLVCVAIIVICCVVCRLDLCPRKATRQGRRRVPATSSLSSAAAAMSGRAGARSRQGRNERGAIWDGGAIGAASRGAESSLRLQENLLNEECTPSQRVPAGQAAMRVDHAALPSYVIRLDSVPAFNPRLRAETGEMKPIDPPPSYDQVIASGHIGASPRNDLSNAPAQQPPAYTPHDSAAAAVVRSPGQTQVQPPPPRFSPPDVPSPPTE